jgi:hypothetical protein
VSRQKTIIVGGFGCIVSKKLRGVLTILTVHRDGYGRNFCTELVFLKGIYFQLIFRPPPIMRDAHQVRNLEEYRCYIEEIVQINPIPHCGRPFWQIFIFLAVITFIAVLVQFFQRQEKDKSEESTVSH